MIWIQRKFEKQSREKISQKEKELSSANGSLKSKEMEFLEPDSLHSDIVKFWMSISTKVSTL
jgi:hypothetical protein